MSRVSSSDEHSVDQITRALLIDKLRGPHQGTGTQKDPISALPTNDTPLPLYDSEFALPMRVVALIDLYTERGKIDVLDRYARILEKRPGLKDEHRAALEIYRELRAPHQYGVAVPSPRLVGDPGPLLASGKLPDDQVNALYWDPAFAPTYKGQKH